jgi:hypothetical protein
MIHIEKSSQIAYYIISNNAKTIFHFGKVEIGQTLVSGLDILEEYNLESEFIERLNELGLYEEYLENNTNE